MFNTGTCPCRYETYSIYGDTVKNLHQRSNAAILLLCCCSWDIFLRGGTYQYEVDQQNTLTKTSSNIQSYGLASGELTLIIQSVFRKYEEIRTFSAECQVELKLFKRFLVLIVSSIHFLSCIDSVAFFHELIPFYDARTDKTVGSIKTQIPVVLNMHFEQCFHFISLHYIPPREQNINNTLNKRSVFRYNILKYWNIHCFAKCDSVRYIIISLERENGPKRVSWRQQTKLL